MYTVTREICRAWRKDGEKKATVGIGATGGKCPECGEIVENLKEWYQAGEYIGGDFLPFDDGFKYCSERCAEKNSTFVEEK